MVFLPVFYLPRNPGQTSDSEVCFFGTNEVIFYHTFFSAVAPNPRKNTTYLSVTSEEVWSKLGLRG